MARHLLLKNNTVSLSQRVKRKQIQNRENMRDNYFLTYDERQTEFSKNYGYLIYEVLTNFLQILHCFLNCLYRFPGIASVRRRKKKKTWGYTFEWGLEMKQYSKVTGQRVFALHMLFQVPIWRPFWKCQIDRSWLEWILQNQVSARRLELNKIIFRQIAPTLYDLVVFKD